LSMVSGNAQAQPYALVVLAEQLRLELQQTGAREQVSAELGMLLKQINQPLAHYEQLQFIVVANTPWGIENGCLTPTMKIKRNRIEDMVKSQVDAWYAQNQDVIWA